MNTTQSRHSNKRRYGSDVNEVNEDLPTKKYDICSLCGSFVENGIIVPDLKYQKETGSDFHICNKHNNGRPDKEKNYLHIT